MRYLWGFGLVTTAMLSLTRGMEFAESAEMWDDGDLSRFVTRPDLTPPIFDITTHKAEQTTPGYLFVAPYDTLEKRSARDASYVTQQIGPHIYDENGELVWSGAEVFRHKKVHDFKVVNIDGSDQLTLIAPNGLTGDAPSKEAAYILNASYQITAGVTIADKESTLDMHEFTLLNDGTNAIILGQRSRNLSVDEANTSGWSGLVLESFFQEVDVRSSNVHFEWASLQHVPVSESAFNPPPLDSKQPWNYFYLNSADKAPDGNYLLSARRTNSIFLVSGKDGSIIWRLGGAKSSFVMNDFTFSGQHDARILSQNDSVTVLSFLDNGIMNGGAEARVPMVPSSLLIVALQTDTVPMMANVLNRYSRPDGETTIARGNVQRLPSNNVLGCWSDNAYITEHTPSGDVVYEASFLSTRFVTYRAFKFNFTAAPIDTPRIKAFASATREGGLTTIIYVSWNGATEVRSWRYYAFHPTTGDTIELGTAPKSGFETSFVFQGFHSLVYVEALDVHGLSLANSSLESAELPLGWYGINVDGRSIGGRNVFGKASPRSLIGVSFLAGLVSTVFSSRLLHAVRRGTSGFAAWLVRHNSMKQS